MAQGSSDWTTGEASDHRAVVGLLRAAQGAVPGCPVEVSVTEGDGKEHRLKATIASLSLGGMTLDIPGHHGLIGKTGGVKVIVWVGSSMFRYRCAMTPGKGRDIALTFGGAPKAAFQETLHPLGHAPVKPQPAVLEEVAPKAPPMPWVEREARAAASGAAAKQPAEPKGKLAKMYQLLQSFGYTFTK